MKTISKIGNNSRSLGDLSEKNGFTLLEVLIAMTILAFGFSYVFPIFFGSASTVVHIENRLRADLAVHNEIWNIKSFITTNVITDEKIEKCLKDTDPEIVLKIHIRKMNSFERLYKVAIVASWKEEDRDVSLERVQYIRDS